MALVVALDAPARAFVGRAVVLRLEPELFVELAGLATTAFFETGDFLFDGDFFAAGARFGAAVFLVEVFFFEVLFLLDAADVFAVFLRVAPVAFLGAVFLVDRLATFLRPDTAERLTVFFREVARPVFLPLLGFFFFLAAACLAGICLASKRDYTKAAIIHTAGASGSL